MQKQQFVLFAVMISTMSGAFAATTGTLPWDTAIATLSASMTGPWAYGVSLVALVGAFATLAFSSDLSGAGRVLVYLTIAIAGLVLVSKLLTDLFGGAAVAQGIATVQFLVFFGALSISTLCAAAEMLIWRQIKNWKPDFRVIFMKQEFAE